jgi:hypothetical protein
MKMIILPRQAPDKHRKNSKKSIVFLTGFQCNGKQVFQRKLYQGDDSKTLFVLFQPDGHTHWVIGRPERVWDCENRGFINSPKDSCPLSVRKNCPLLRLAVFLLRTKEKPIVCQRQTRDKHQKTEQKRSVFAHNHAAGSVRVQ